jgi:hypothetical protein
MLKVYAIVLASLFVGTHAMADQIQLQFYGDVPNKFRPTIVWYSINNCSTPCRVSDWKEVKVPKTADGVGVVMVDIPENATRLCLQEVDGYVIEDITIYMKKGGKKITRRKDGGNIDADGGAGCHEASVRAADAKFINVTLKAN